VSRFHWETYSERVVGCCSPGPGTGICCGGGDMSHVAVFSTSHAGSGWWVGRCGEVESRRSQGVGKVEENGGLEVRVKDFKRTNDYDYFYILFLFLFYFIVWWDCGFRELGIPFRTASRVSRPPPLDKVTIPSIDRHLCAVADGLARPISCRGRRPKYLRTVPASGTLV
jgi:hypothetical protein